MASEQFQAAQDSIYTTGTRLFQYLQEIRQDRLSEGDNTKGLQSVEDDINKALTALKQQKYQVSVKDSSITIQDTGIQTIPQNSAWNLLSDALAILDKAAKAIEDTINIRLSGWEMEIETLKQQTENYRKRSFTAKSKLQDVKKSVDEQKQRPIEDCSNKISNFAKITQDKIDEEIKRIAELLSDKLSVKESENIKHSKISLFDKEKVLIIPEWIPSIGGNSLKFEARNSLLDKIQKAIPLSLFNQTADKYRSFYTYKISFKTREEVQKIVLTINEFCAPHIKMGWLDTQAQILREGTEIRKRLVQKIQNDLQEISNELSNYIGQILEIEINTNPIQFPSFELSGIDAQVKYHQELHTTNKKQNNRAGEKQHFCEADNSHIYRITQEKEVKIKRRRSYHELNLHEIAEAIKLNIDNQALESKKTLQRVIEKLIAEDFRYAEQQINDYIKRFQDEFERLLKERETKKVEADQVRETLNQQKAQLNQYLRELSLIRESLNSCKPVHNLTIR